MIAKFSSTAAIRAFRRGALSLAGLKGASRYTNKIMRINRLGSGSFQEASRIVHPRLGQITQKMPLKVRGQAGTRIGSIPTKTIGPRRTATRNVEYEALKRLRVLSGGDKNVQVAQILGRKGPVHFQEYSKPNVLDRALIKDERVLRKIQGSTAAKKKAANFNARVDALNKRFTAIPTFNKPTQKVLQRFKEEYPRMWDVKSGNVIGGKLVDFEAGIRVARASVAKAPQQTVTAAPALKNALGVPVFPKKRAASAWGSPSHRTAVIA